jgi:3-oxoadipate enol-lactonase
VSSLWRIANKRLEVLGRTQGRGRLLCLPAWAAHAGYWAPTLSALPDDVAVLALSLSGHGRSEPPSEPLPSLAPWLDEVEGVLDAAGWPDAILVGNSAGGGLALIFTAERPARVRGLVLVGASPGGQAASTAEPTRRVVGNLYRASRLPQNGRLVERLIRRQLAMLPEPVRQQVADGSLGTHPLALEGSARFSWLYDLDATVRRLARPTLVVRGLADPLLDPAYEPLAAIPGAVLAELPGVGHFPMAEDPVRFAGLLLEAVAWVEDGRRPGRVTGVLYPAAADRLPTATAGGSSPGHDVHGRER